MTPTYQEASEPPLAERPLFFYGTLRDPDLLARVTNRPTIDELERRKAFLPNARVGRVAGEGFPMLFADADRSAEGLLVFGLTPDERARIAFFEDSDYALKGVEVWVEQDGAEPKALAAAMYYPTERLRDSGEPWSLERWAETEKDLLMACAEEQLSYFGRVPQALVETFWPEIKARAEKRLGLRPPSIRSAFDRSSVEEIEREEPYRGFFRATEVKVRHETFRGGRSDVLRRSGWRVGEVVTALPYDVVRDELVLIEQWRAGAWLAGDETPSANPWVVEVVAGRIDAGEAPDAAARRETAEEAGVTVDRLEPIGVFYSSPGATDERIHAFLAEANLSQAGGVYGVDTENEDIRVIRLSFWEAMTALARGDIEAGPAIISLLWLSRNRERLRLNHRKRS